jgi:hypothetical protein
MVKNHPGFKALTYNNPLVQTLALSSLTYVINELSNNTKINSIENTFNNIKTEYISPLFEVTDEYK